MVKELDIIDKDEETELEDIADDVGDVEVDFADDNSDSEDGDDSGESKKESDEEVDFKIDIPDFEYTPTEPVAPKQIKEEVAAPAVDEEKLMYMTAYAKSELKLTNYEIDKKEAELDAAIEDGDNRAQRRIQKELDALEDSKKLFEQAIANDSLAPKTKQEPARQEPAQPELNPVVAAWAEQNKSWFGQKGHEEATKKAVSVYEGLIAEGYSEFHPNTFKKVNEILRGNKSSGQPADKKASTVLSVNKPATNGGKTRVQISRKEMISMGFNPENKEHVAEYGKMQLRLQAEENKK